MGTVQASWPLGPAIQRSCFCQSHSRPSPSCLYSSFLALFYLLVFFINFAFFSFLIKNILLIHYDQWNNAKKVQRNTSEFPLPSLPLWGNHRQLQRPEVRFHLSSSTVIETLYTHTVPYGKAVLAICAYRSGTYFTLLPMAKLSSLIWCSPACWYKINEYSVFHGTFKLLPFPHHQSNVYHKHSWSLSFAKRDAFIYINWSIRRGC